MNDGRGEQMDMPTVLAILFFGLLILLVIAILFWWRSRLGLRCPECGRWGSKKFKEKVVSEIEIDVNTPARMRIVEALYGCPHCGHRWTRRETS